MIEEENDLHEEHVDEELLDGEQDRPSWLPSNFRSPEALVESFRHSQAALTQAKQLLSERDQEFDAYLAQQEAGAEERREAGRAQHLNLLAEQVKDEAARAYRATFADTLTVPMPEPDDPDVLVFQAEQVVASRVEDWPAVSDDVFEAIAQNLDLLPEEMSRGSLAHTLELVAETVRQSKLARAFERENSTHMKRQAQTLTGAGARLEPQDDDSAFFERLKTAHQTTYAASRNA